MQVSSADISFLTKLASATDGSANSIASLQARLKDLLQQVKEVGINDSLTDEAKQQMQKLLQAQIQIIMQRIAELQSQGKKSAIMVEAQSQISTPATIVKAATPATTGIDTFA